MPAARVLVGLRDLVLILAIAAGSLAGLELVLRLVFAEEQARPSLGAMNDMAFEHHPEYLVVIKPDLRERPFTRLTREGAVVTHWSTNSDSLRGAAVGEKRGPRVIVYGDSNVFARFSDEENTFAGRLQSLLRVATSQPVEVLNAGVPGFGPDQSFLRLREQADRLRPDVVVFQVFADNDFGDMIRNRIFYFSEDGALVQRSVADDRDACLLNADCAPPAVDLATRARDFARSLYVTRALMKLLRQAGIDLTPPPATPEQEIGFYLHTCEREYESYLQPASGSFSSFADHYDFDVALEPGREAAVVKARLMRAVLGAAAKLAAERDIGFLLLIEPSSRDLTQNLAPNFQHFGRYPAYRREGLSQNLAATAEALQIEYVNLFEVYARHDPSRLYFTDGDNHWNDLGQAVAAEAAAPRVAAMLAARSASGGTAAARLPEHLAAPVAAGEHAGEYEEQIGQTVEVAQ